MSNAVLSVTVAMHGSGSTSSLASLEQRTDSPLPDDTSHPLADLPEHTIVIDEPLPSRPQLLVSHDDSDDSDSDTDDGHPRAASHRAVRPPSPVHALSSPSSSRRGSTTADVLRLASARIRAGSCTSADMAVEMAHVAKEQSRRESSTLPPFSIRLLDTDGREVAALSPDADDVFSLDTFSALHRQRRSLGKALLIAQVCTRDRSRTAFDAVTYSYYDALPLLRVLYKVQATQAGVRLRHRYHQYSAINPINPLTNTCVIGDIRFFVTEAVDGPHCPPSPTGVDRAGGSGEFITARYVGTDYHFTFQQQLRAAFFLPNALPSSSSSASPDDFVVMLDHLLQQPQKPRHRPAAWQGPGADQLAALVQAQLGVPQPTLRFVDVAFPRAVVYGIVLALYGLVCFGVFECGLQDLINGATRSSIDLSSVWYFAVPPPCSLLFDMLTAVLYDTREHPAVYPFKAVVYAAYYVVPLVLLTGDGQGVNVGRQAWEVVMPIVFLLYSLGYFFWLRRKARLE